MSSISWREFVRLNADPHSILSVRLPDYWWLVRRHHFGRSGHGYAAPFLLTLMMQWHRLLGREAYWVAEAPAWFYEDSDLYEPATPMYQKRGVRYGLVIPTKLAWWVNVEMWLDRTYNRVGFELWQRFGVGLPQRQPLGKGLALPRLAESTLDSR